MKISAISLWEPYATAMRLGLKTIETRNKPTSYRGPLAIAATQSFPGPERYSTSLVREVRERRLFDRFEPGCVQCVVMVRDCRSTEDVASSIGETEKAFGDYSSGRFAWITDSLFLLPHSIPARGGQFIWHWEVPLAIQPAIEEMVRNALVRA